MVNGLEDTPFQKPLLLEKAAASLPLLLAVYKVFEATTEVALIAAAL